MKTVLLTFVAIFFVVSHQAKATNIQDFTGMWKAEQYSDVVRAVEVRFASGEVKLDVYPQGANGYFTLTANSFADRPLHDPLFYTQRVVAVLKTSIKKGTYILRKPTPDGKTMILDYFADYPSNDSLRDDTYKEITLRYAGN